MKDSLTTPTETMKNNSAAEIAQKSSDSVTEIAESLPNSPIETVKKVSHTSTKSQNYTTDDPKKEPPFSQTPFLKASVLSPQSPAFTPSRNKAIEGDDLLLSISSGSLQSSIHATRGKQSEITSHTKLYSPAPSYPNVSHNNSGFKNPHSLTNSSAEVSSQSTRNSLSFGYKNTKGAQVDRPRNELISYDVDTPAISEEHSVLMSSFQEPTKTPLASTRLEKQPLITLKPLEPLESSKIMKVSKKSRWISDCLVTPPKTQLQTHDTSENLKPPKTPRHMIPYDPQPESPELFNKMYAIAQIMQDKSEKERKDKVAQEKKKRDEDEAQRKHKEADVQRKAKEAETKENGDWETVTENNDPGYPSTVCWPHSFASSVCFVYTYKTPSLLGFHLTVIKRSFVQIISLQSRLLLNFSDRS